MRRNLTYAHSIQKKTLLDTIKKKMINKKKTYYNKTPIGLRYNVVQRRKACFNSHLYFPHKFIIPTISKYS